MNTLDFCINYQTYEVLKYKMFLSFIRISLILYKEVLVKDNWKIEHQIHLTSNTLKLLQYPKYMLLELTFHSNLITLQMLHSNPLH